jgi:hypothetical protein
MRARALNFRRNIMLAIKDAPRLSRLGILRADIQRIVEQTKAELNAGIKVKQMPSHPKGPHRRKFDPTDICSDR